MRNPQRDRYHRVNVRSEFEAICAVGAAGLGPRAFFCSEAQQSIVMEYLDGQAFTVPTITSEMNLPRAAQAIRKLHAVHPRGVSYNIETVIENYLTSLESHPLMKPEYAAGVRAILVRCQKSVGARRVAMGHGDLAAHNIFECDGIKFIDMEMAGANDLHFDLATFFMFNGLTAEQEQVFLREYGDVDSGRLADARYLVNARDGLWAISELVSGKVSDDYTRVIEHHFRAIAAMAACEA